MLTIEYAKNPVWANSDGTAIFLDVKFFEFSEELPFAATNYDVMPYGVDLYNQASAGKFGTVAPYIPDSTITSEQPVVTGAQTL